MPALCGKTVVCFRIALPSSHYERSKLQVRAMPSQWRAQSYLKPTCMRKQMDFQNSCPAATALESLKKTGTLLPNQVS